VASSEGILWDWIKRHPDVASNSLDIHMQRVENVVGKATPDIEGCYRRGAFHLETKMLHQERKTIDGGELRFEQGQREWGQRRWLAGGMAYALIGAKERVWLVPGLFLPSLPLRGPVTHAALDQRCILTRCMTGRFPRTPPVRDTATVVQMFILLADPGLSRMYAAELAGLTPGIDEIALSPVETILADEGFIDSRSRMRFGQRKDTSHV
jgi:hypothetical protein